MITQRTRLFDFVESFVISLKLRHHVVVRGRLPYYTNYVIYSTYGLDLTGG